MIVSHRGRAAATLDRLVDLLADVEGIQLRHLKPLTTVLVRTMKSVYRVVITRWPEVYVHGGAFFPDPTRACLDGASLGGNCIKVDWIVVGLRMEIRSEGRRIVTSPVCALSIEQPSDSVVH
jgi:hypothetical protein